MIARRAIEAYSDFSEGQADDMKGSKVGLERIRKVLLRDKTGAQEDLVAVLKSDACELFDCYFEVDPRSLSAEIEVDEYGYYKVTVSARAFRVRGTFHSG